MHIKTVPTTPFHDQNAGTSGLRKKVSEFQQPHYIENFIQSVFNALGSLEGRLLVIGGDGRYYNRAAIQIIIKMAVAQKLGKIIIGQHGILSTPATSHIIRKYKAYGGFILSASHNKGGVNGDFGIKYNIANGGPAPEKITKAIYAQSQKLSHYQIAETEDIIIDKTGCFAAGTTKIEIIDSVRDYTEMMEELFDFPLLRRFYGKENKNFTFRFDAMNAVTGPYAQEIFENKLAMPKGTVIRATPLPDFGGIHPDPNLVYAKDLCDAVLSADGPNFGAASDGDGDRNLIIGRNMFVTPSDSLAILAANARLVKAYKNGIKGVARSMPTSEAVDRVAKKQNLPYFETPTGWKFFGNLLDSGRATLCGEESFGTGADHIREKDGLWAVLMWLSILAITGKSVEQLVKEHWLIYGRNYYSRYDYEGVDSIAAHEMMEAMRAKLANLSGAEINGLKIIKADDFSYHDPIDNSLSSHQGIRFFLQPSSNSHKEAGDPQSRFVFRLSGTGTEGATVRIYFEHYEQDKTKHHENVQKVLAPLIQAAEKVSDLKRKLRRTQPDVIT